MLLVWQKRMQKTGLDGGNRFAVATPEEKSQRKISRFD